MTATLILRLNFGLGEVVVAAPLLVGRDVLKEGCLLSGFSQSIVKSLKHRVGADADDVGEAFGGLEGVFLGGLFGLEKGCVFLSFWAGKKCSEGFFLDVLFSRNTHTASETSPTSGMCLGLDSPSLFCFC
jgi:hypothetical protein